MLHLQPRVHFEEIKRWTIDQNSIAGIAILDGARPARPRPSSPRPQPGVSAGDGLSSMTFWCRLCTEALALEELDGLTVIVRST
jgi:hypothetical protein